MNEMTYTTLYLNDNGTAKVQMTIDDHVLEQDIVTGDSQDDFQGNVEAAMAVFKAELDANSVNAYEPALDTPTTVESLPDLDE